MTTDAAVTSQPAAPGTPPDGDTPSDNTVPPQGLWRRRSGPALPARDVVAIALAGVGTLLLFVSLLVDWQRTVVLDAESEVRLDAGIGDIPTWGTAYVVGGMLLVALFVGVVVLPVHLGRAARVLGIAWAVTIAGVVAAALVRLAQRPADLNIGLLGGLLGGFGQPGDVTYSWGPGAYFAGAALLAMVAAFGAACPALRDSDN